MQCRKCGNYNGVGDMFCSQCGNKLFRGKKSSKKMLIFVWCMSILVLGVIMFFVSGILSGGAGVVFKNDVPKTVFSAEIGEVEGNTYCIRDNVSTCPKLPVDELGKVISSFCQYDGYVYYMLTDSGSSDYNCWLYRCKKDFTEPENIDTLGDSNNICPSREFVIDSGKLYYESGESDVIIDLKTLEKTYGEMPVYSVSVNNTLYNDSDKFASHHIEVYNDITFFSSENNDLYMVLDGVETFISANGYIDGGLAGEYFYYAKFNSAVNSMSSELYRYNIKTGAEESVGMSMVAGGGGPFFCW